MVFAEARAQEHGKSLQFCLVFVVFAEARDQEHGCSSQFSVVFGFFGVVAEARRIEGWNLAILNP